MFFLLYTATKKTKIDAIENSDLDFRYDLFVSNLTENHPEIRFGVFDSIDFDIFRDNIQQKKTSQKKELGLKFPEKEKSRQKTI